MSDLKDMFQERASEIAGERYDCNFYDLPVEVRDAIYEEAMRCVVESWCDMADGMEQ
jgi:hypothetical protein